MTFLTYIILGALLMYFVFDWEKFKGERLSALYVEYSIWCDTKNKKKATFEEFKPMVLISIFVMYLLLCPCILWNKVGGLYKEWKK